MQGHLLERRRGEDRKVLFFKIEHWCRKGTSSCVHSYTDIYVYFVYFCIFWIYLYILPNYQPILRRQCYLHRCSMNNKRAKEILENLQQIERFCICEENKHITIVTLIIPFCLFLAIHLTKFTT